MAIMMTMLSIFSEKPLQEKRKLIFFSPRKRDWGDGKLSTFTAFHYYHFTAQNFIYEVMLFRDSLIAT